MWAIPFRESSGQRKRQNEQVSRLCLRADLLLLTSSTAAAKVGQHDSVSFGG